MNKLLLSLLIAISISPELFSQANCSSPYVINICPDVYLTNQTNLGMLNDAPSSINIPGEDIVYQINVPPTSTALYFTVVNASGPYKLSLLKTTCTNTPYSSSTYNAGSSNFYFTSMTGSTYFIWIDATTPITYDLAIGADTISVPYSIPNTQGLLQFDQSGCGTPYFNPAKPYFQLSFNGIFQTDPMTLAPLFAPGTMCISSFFKNLTGVEAIAHFKFDFSVLGFSNIQCPDSFPGFYTPGYWMATRSGNIINYDFIDSLHTGIGDFDGTPNSCLNYRFCFDLIPLSNLPANTNINVQMSSDGKGAPSSGTIRQGCCPSTIPNCHAGGGGGGGGGAHGFGFGVNDPGNPLPIELINFEIIKSGKNIDLNWSTASETNNDYFSIERSKDANEWENLRNIQGSGNSSGIIKYKSIDENPHSGISYYRLKQTDYDGKFSYPATKSIILDASEEFIIYPNPAKDILTIENANSEEYSLALYSNFGNKIIVPTKSEAGKTIFYTSELESGVYFLLIFNKNDLISKKIISIMK